MPTPAMPLITTGATVPGLYSHIAHLVDRDEEEIPPPFKGAKLKQTRGRGKPKGKPQGHRQSPLKDQEADEAYTYNNTNNYYHNDNYTAPGQNQGHRIKATEENASLFTDDAAAPCDFNITNQNSVTENTNDTNISQALEQSGIHTQSKHKYRNTFGKSNIQYHNFDNQDSLTFRDKYTTLLQQELQNPYWCFHNPVTTKSYQISKDMDTETMPHAMYFTSNTDTVTKNNHILYQTIAYNENGMFTAKLMNDTPVEIFIDNGATPSILPLHTYNKFPILHTYPKTESNTPIHTGGGLVKSHVWLKIQLKLDHQTIQIKALVCDSECPYDIILGWTSMAQLSAWQYYASPRLYIQQISVPQLEIMYVCYQEKQELYH